MQSKTIKAIENMKRQTIGVEVEMNNITRENAAKIVAKFFGTNRTQYIDDGYRTWVAYDANGRKWAFKYDSSIHGPVDERCELVTPILMYEDIETLQKVIRLLRKNGAKSCPSRGCGVHIHIGLIARGGMNNHDAKSLRNLANIMAAHEEQIGRAIHISANRTQKYCKVVNPLFIHRLNAEKPTTMGQLENIWYSAHGYSYPDHSHYNPSRYHMLNYHACFTKGTIEFRLFQFSEETADRKGGLHAGELKAYIQLCLAMSEMAKELKYASPKSQQTENEKYAMRCWMLRLGFIGDEFKTARDILLKNMDGNAAYRNAI